MIANALRSVDRDQPGESLRTPPHNYEAERALLGGILMNNYAFDRVSDFLKPEHFADPVNSAIFDAIVRVIETGAQANPVTLKTRLEGNPLVQEAGGIKYLASLAGAAVTVINVGDYGQLVYDLALRRELIAIGDTMINDAFEGDVEDYAPIQIERAEERLFNLVTHGPSGGLSDVGEAAHNAIALAQVAHRNGGKLVGIPTGLKDLDAKLGGLHDTDLLILAGRPSMGKTGLATTMAVSAAQYFATTDKAEHRGKNVAFFSLEMSKEQLATRILSHLGRLDSHAIRNGFLKDEEFERLVIAGTELSAMPLKIDDTPAPTVAAIRARARRLARKGGLGLIVIDYLQLISAGGRDRPENRVQEISAITRGLKALAKDLKVPVLALSQLSRALEAREDKRPQLSDLRESGTIEQDADVVMFVFREQYYLERAEPQQRGDESKERWLERYSAWDARLREVVNTAEVLLAKQRHGPIGTLRAHFDGPTTWFSDLETKHEEPPVRGASRETHSGPPPGHPAAETIPMDF